MFGKPPQTVLHRKSIRLLNSHQRYRKHILGLDDGPTYLSDELLRDQQD